MGRRREEGENGRGVGVNNGQAARKVGHCERGVDGKEKLRRKPTGG